MLLIEQTLPSLSDFVITAIAKSQITTGSDHQWPPRTYCRNPTLSFLLINIISQRMADMCFQTYSLFTSVSFIAGH